MKYLTFALILLATVADAQWSGCYSNSTSSCSSFSIACNSNYSFDTLYYGYPIAELCEAKRAAEQSITSAAGKLQACDNGFTYYKGIADQCLDLAQGTANDLTACAANRDNYYNIASHNYAAATQNAATIKKYKALEKKLRSTCGSKCKKLKL